jgi:hypothetical protein
VQGRIKANACPKHRSVLVPCTFHLHNVKPTDPLMPRLNIIVKCLTLNSEFNFQTGQASYIKII